MIVFSIAQSYKNQKFYFNYRVINFVIRDSYFSEMLLQLFLYTEGTTVKGSERHEAKARGSSPYLH